MFRGLLFATAINVVFLIPGTVMAGVYVCKIIEDKVLSDSGQIVPQRYGMSEEGRTIVFDDKTGSMQRLKSTWKYKIIQKGTEKNSLRALRIYEGISQVVVGLIEIETWKPGIPFIHFGGGGSEVLSGTCTRVGAE
jgi:hypothetical protein